MIDLHWDVVDRSFNLCPVHIPSFDNETANAEANSVQHDPATVIEPRSSLYLDLDGLSKRQDQTTNATASPTNTSDSTTTASATTSSISGLSTSEGDDGDTLVTLGPFRCGQDLDLESIIDIVVDFLSDTSDSSAANLLILEFNLHSTSSAADPEGPPQRVSSDQHPTTSQLVGTRFDREMGSQVYNPRDLAADRANLNSSWFEVRAAERLPMTEYFSTETLPDGTISTENGWPSELYLLLSRLERVILTWGTIDAEMEGYDFAADVSHVFSSGSLTDDHALLFNQDGVVTSGCFYRDDEKDVEQVNNTWAVMRINDTQDTAQTNIQNMTSCGVSPILNTLLGQNSAGNAYLPYQSLTQAAVLGWADGEPRNVSSPGADTEGDEDQYRCVVIDSSNDYRGKWRVVNCQDRYRAACRIGGQPYNWRLSNSETAFTGAPDSCPQGSRFDLPVSHLENTYLYEHILDDAANTSDSSLPRGVYINLNALDEMDCWVTTGPNGTCRYQQNSNEQRNREVLIPTIAALIILILTVLTILVKCNVNRRNNRRHRVGPGGWEYEGVPS